MTVIWVVLAALLPAAFGGATLALLSARPRGPADWIWLGAAGWLLAILALFTVIRPMTKRAFAPAPVVRELAAGVIPGDRPRTIEEMEAAAAGGTAAMSLPMDAAHRLPVLARQVGRLATEEPEQLARIVRGWLAEEEH